MTDLVQCPSNRSEYATRTGRRAVKVQIIRVGRKSVNQDGSSDNGLEPGSVPFKGIGLHTGLYIKQLTCSELNIALFMCCRRVKGGVT